jgi:hypothetical protein
MSHKAGKLIKGFSEIRFGNGEKCISLIIIGKGDIWILNI